MGGLGGTSARIRTGDFLDRAHDNGENRPCVLGVGGIGAPQWTACELLQRAPDALTDRARAGCRYHGQDEAAQPSAWPYPRHQRGAVPKPSVVQIWIMMAEGSGRQRGRIDAIVQRRRDGIARASNLMGALCTRLRPREG